MTARERVSQRHGTPCSLCGTIWDTVYGLELHLRDRHNFDEGTALALAGELVRRATG